MTTRRQTERSRRPRPERAIVRDFRGPSAGYEVEFDGRTVFDFVASILVEPEDEEELSAEDRQWLAETRAAVPADVARILRGKGKAAHPPNLAAPAVARRDLADARAYVEVIETAETPQALRWLLGSLFDGAEVEPHAEAALAGNREAIAAIEKLTGRKAETAVLRNPDPWLRRLRAALRSWLERYEPLEERIRRALERDLALRAADRATLEPAQLVERTTGGIRFLADPGVRRVILAPSYFGRPYNTVFAANGWRLFCYPIADSAIAEPDRFLPPLSALRLYRALGDETRLRILKLLSERDHYLTELAQQLELSKPTVKHHLRQLRVAGLVTLTEEGALTYYSLRPEGLEAAGKEVRDYLLT